MEPNVRVYQKENNLSPWKVLKESLQDIYNSRFLARQLAERDIRAQYRQSYLGIIWAFITPLFTAAVWIFLTLSGTIEVTETGIPYPLYVFSGTLLVVDHYRIHKFPFTKYEWRQGLVKQDQFSQRGIDHFRNLQVAF